jgi:hypothetical protein
MTEGPLPGLFWRVADAADYLVTLVRLRIPDALAGSEPETPADQQRGRSGAAAGGISESPARGP